MKRRKKPQKKSRKLTNRDVRLNSILAGLDGAESGAVMATGALVDLPVRQPIYMPELPINDVYFPIDSVLSVVTQMKDGNQIEVGTIGREGTSGIPLLLGATTTANESYFRSRERPSRSRHRLSSRCAQTQSFVACLTAMSKPM